MAEAGPGAWKDRIMTLIGYINTLRRYWIIIVLLGVLGAAGAYGYARTLPKQYSSQASVMVIPAKGETTGELVQGSNYVQNLVHTYTVIAASPIVLDQVISALNLTEQSFELARRVNIESPLDTVIITISVTDATPEGAQNVANAIANSLSSAVSQLSPKSSGGIAAVRIEVISPARFTNVPSAPNMTTYTLLGLAGGLMLGVAFVVIRKLLGTRISSPSDIAELTDVPQLGEVANIGDRDTVPALVLSKPNSRVAESLRNVVAGLRFVDVEHTKRVLLLTSPSASEGKTSVSLGIAITLAEVGNRVLYIEADLRRPKATQYTQLDGTVGLTSVLLGDHSLEDSVQQWGNPNLHVLLSGKLPPNPSQLLSSDQLRGLVDHAAEIYDYVILDSAPVLPVADATWLTSLVHGTLLIVRVNRTTRQAMMRAVSLVDGRQAPLLGIIVNGGTDKTKSPYYAVETPKKRSTRRWNKVGAGAGRLRHRTLDGKAAVAARIDGER